MGTLTLPGVNLLDGIGYEMCGERSNMFLYEMRTFLNEQAIVSKRKHTRKANQKLSKQHAAFIMTSIKDEF